MPGFWNFLDHFEAKDPEIPGRRVGNVPLMLVGRPEIFQCRLRASTACYRQEVPLWQLLAERELFRWNMDEYGNIRHQEQCFVRSVIAGDSYVRNV